jgi:hypothetical protein
VSTAALVILIDVYALGAIFTWMRALRGLPTPAHIGELVGDVLIISLWPIMWTIAIVRLLVLTVFTKEVSGPEELS